MKRYSIILLSMFLLCIPAFSQSEPEYSASISTEDAIPPMRDPPEIFSRPLVEGEAVPVADVPSAEPLPAEESLPLAEISPEPVPTALPVAEPLLAESLPEDTTSLEEAAPIAEVPTPLPAEETVPVAEVPAPLDEPASVQTAPPPVTVTKVEETQPASRIEPPSPLIPGRDIKVIPGLPDPNSRKVYRLQVGAYSVEANADISVALLRSGGFRVGRERFNSMYRVLAIEIPAKDVYDAVQKLGALGFASVWIRE